MPWGITFHTFSIMLTIWIKNQYGQTINRATLWAMRGVMPPGYQVPYI
jgi:hypothetical protein